MEKNTHKPKKYLSTNLAEDGREIEKDWNLSDEIKTGIDVNDSRKFIREIKCEPYIKSKKVKEKIQNVQRRLKKEIIKFRDSGFSFRNWKIILPQIIDKIFLEEFGDKLLKKSKRRKNGKQTKN